MSLKAFLFPETVLSGKTRNILLAILIASTVIKLFFAYSVPIYVDQRGGEFRPLNDEYSHYKYITFLIKEHRLPVNKYLYTFENPIAWIFQDFEYAQPPLYYVLSVPFALLPNPIFACRIFSVLLGIATLWLIILSALKVSRFGQQIAIVISILVAFHPIFLRIGSTISNDNLGWLLSAFLFRLLLVDPNLSHKYVWGGLIGAGILTKVSFLIWPVFLASLLIYESISERKLRAAVIKNIFAVLIIAFGLAGWMFVRNIHNYGEWSGFVGTSTQRSALLSRDVRVLQATAEQSIRYCFFQLQRKTQTCCEHVLP